jgi:site-specific DNA-methyltransferase (adenine-specific)/adenine-specific DNA-methyltransferase
MTKTNTPAQEILQLATPDGGTTNVEKYDFEPIKGYPMLNWRGKRPFTSTQYYPAQLKEIHGEEVDSWRNKIFWGDNLQVMSHLLKQFRGKIDLIYIDPPFDSRADYRKTISTKGTEGGADYNSFEEKQYSDIWSNDEYLQFMFERLTLMRELLSPKGNLFLHCDYRKNSHLRLMLDEVFGPGSMVNEIVWKRKGGSSNPTLQLDAATDTIYWYRNSADSTINQQYSKDTPEAKRYISERFKKQDAAGRLYRESPIVSPNYRENLVYEYKGYNPPPNGWSVSRELMAKLDSENRLYFPENGDRIYRKIYLDEYQGQPIGSLWTDIFVVNPVASERLGYPTQKPEALLRRIIELGSNSGDVVFDCFMGSGTTQSVAMQLGRRFIGADINLGSIQTTTKRLLKVLESLRQKTLIGDGKVFAGFELHNVNHYDVFRNPIQAKELLIEALEVQKLEFSTVFEGEKDGRMVKIMPVNRIATRADLNELIAGFDYKSWERKQNENPNRPVEKISLVCMGHEPDLAAQLELAAKPFKIDVEVVDILRDKAHLEFKRDSEAKIVIKKGELVIAKFYPMNLLQKLSIQKESVDDWKELVESVLIDWNYDGAVLQPSVVDIPGRDELVKGTYKVPDDAGTIRVKITDLLSESWEGSVGNGD